MSQTENASREKILARIRTALREPAPRHEPSDTAAIFAPVTDPLDRFQKECVINISECFLVPSLQAAAASIKNVLADLPEGDIFVQDAPDLRPIATEWQNGRDIQWSSEGSPREASQATITLAEALVAQG